MNRIATALPFLVRSHSPFQRPTIHFDTPKGDEAGGAPGQPGGAPPVGTPAPPAGAAPPAGGTPPKEAGNGQFEPGWLNDRIAQAKRSAETELLKKLGVDDPEAAAKILAEGKKAIDANKTELEKKDEQIKSLEKTAKKADGYQKKLSERAQAELSQLPAAAQEKIKALVGDDADPIKLLETIDLAKAMGGGAPQQPAGAPSGAPQPGQPQGTPAGQGKPPVPAPANTSGAAGGPPSAPGSPTDHLAVYRDMQSKNPMAAAHYMLANQQAIVEAMQKENQK